MSEVQERNILPTLVNLSLYINMFIYLKTSGLKNKKLIHFTFTYHILLQLL